MMVTHRSTRTEAPFQQLLRIAEPFFGHRRPGDISQDWPDAEEVGVNSENLAEFKSPRYETFARWFDDCNVVELLVVISNVHPTKNFADYLATLEDSLPSDLEVDNPEFEIGTPICVALNYSVDHAVDDEFVATKCAQLAAFAEEIAAAIAP